MEKSLFHNCLRSSAEIAVCRNDVMLLSTTHYDNRSRHIAHGLKSGNIDAIVTAAYRMARCLPENSILIPMPSHTGVAKQTLRLAKMISKISGCPVCDCLVGRLRERNYDCKKNGHPLTVEDLGIRLVCDIPSGYVPVVLDNCIDTGVSAFAAAAAIGSCVVLTYAMTSVLL